MAKFAIGDIIVLDSASKRHLPLTDLRGLEGTFTVTKIDGIIWPGIEALINVKHAATGKVFHGVFEDRFKMAGKLLPNGYRVGEKVQVRGTFTGSILEGVVTEADMGFRDTSISVWVKVDGRFSPVRYPGSRVYRPVAAPAKLSGSKADVIIADEVGTVTRKRDPKKSFHIIAVLDENGQPRPAKEPVVLTSKAQAEKVAEDMAKRYPGQHFTVLSSTFAAFLPKAPAVETFSL